MLIPEPHSSIFFEDKENFLLLKQKLNNLITEKYKHLVFKYHIDDSNIFFFINFNYENQESDSYQSHKISLYNEEEIIFVFNQILKIYDSRSTCDHNYEKAIIEKGEFKGQFYTDGRGVCSKCGHKSINAISNQKTCIVSGEITTNQIDGEYITIDSYFKRGFKTNFKKFNENITKINLFDINSIAEDNFYFSLEYKILEILFFQLKNEEDIVFLRDNLVLQRIFIYMENTIPDLFKTNGTFKDFKDPIIHKLAIIISKNFEKINSFVYKNQKNELEDFINIKLQEIKQ